ncbi:MAG: uracil-DNA glycosylase [Nitrospirae bacterium]|nr:uracil-DNA glycosylase [Nitrospirota bacterium]
MTVAVEEIKSLLRFYQALGFGDLPITVSPAGKAAPAEDMQQGDAEVIMGVLPADQTGDKDDQLRGLRDYIGDCQRCKLSKQRKCIVFGSGNAGARLMFIGEAPGKEEDLQGLPFVGDAGMLLTRLIEKMGLKRDDVYIANIIKCRPPVNRDPEEEEVAACRGFIEKQIAIIRPTVIMTLGRIALQSLMNSPDLKITAARGHFLDYKGIPVMPTFHPAYLLRNPRDKMLTWSDAQKVLARLGLSAGVKK